MVNILERWDEDTQRFVQYNQKDSPRALRGLNAVFYLTPQTRFSSEHGGLQIDFPPISAERLEVSQRTQEVLGAEEMMEMHSSRGHGTS
jgi:hypothetical protein